MQRSNGFCFVFVISLAILASCTWIANPGFDSPRPSLILTPLPVRVQLPVALEPFSEYIYRCRDLYPELSLNLKYTISNEHEARDADVILWWGIPPESSTAYPLAEEKLQVIWNAENTVRQLTLEIIREIFAGSIRSWDELGGEPNPLQLWTFSPNALSHQILYTETQIKLGTTLNQWIAPDPQTMLDAILEDDAAIGYIPAAWSDDSVNALGIDALLPIVALTSGDAQNSARQLISCLQGDLVQGLISQKYPSMSQP